MSTNLKDFWKPLKSWNISTERLVSTTEMRNLFLMEDSLAFYDPAQQIGSLTALSHLSTLSSFFIYQKISLLCWVFYLLYLNLYILRRIFFQSLNHPSALNPCHALIIIINFVCYCNRNISHNLKQIKWWKYFSINFLLFCIPYDALFKIRRKFTIQQEKINSKN